MSRADLLPLLDPEVRATDWIEDFTSRKGRPFTARLVLKANGRHSFEFKPREKKPGAAGGAKRGKGRGKQVAEEASETEAVAEVVVAAAAKPKPAKSRKK